MMSPGEYFTRFHARLARSVERTTLNRVVVGSSPTLGVSKIFFWQNKHATMTARPLHIFWSTFWLIRINIGWENKELILIQKNHGFLRLDPKLLYFTVFFKNKSRGPPIWEVSFFFWGEEKLLVYEVLRSIFMVESERANLFLRIASSAMSL